MRRMEPRAGHMVRWNPKTDGRYVHTAAFDLSKEAEGRVGRIYGLMAADAPVRSGEALFAHLEDSIGRGVLEAMRKTPSDAPKELVFETAIAFVNRAVTRLMGEHGIGLEPEFVTAALVAVQGDRIAAAVWGRPTLLLYRRSPSDSSQAFDLIGDDESSASRRCFGSIIAGPLETNDRILVASDDPRNVVNELKLAAMMSAPDPGASAARIREELSGAEEGPSLALLTLDVAQVRYVEDGGAAVSTGSSIAALQHMETKTGEIMSPSAMTALQKSIVQTASVIGTKAATGAKHAAHAGPSIGAKVGKLARMLATNERKRIPDIVRERTDATMTKIVNAFNGLGTARRTMLLVGLLAVYALNSSMLALTWNERLASIAAAGEQRLADIGHQIDSAEASMLYRDEARARAILAEASAAVAALPSRSVQDSAAKTALLERIDRSRDTMRRAVKLGAPEVVATVTADGATTELARLAATKDAVWTATSGGMLYRIVGGNAEKSADIGDATALLPAGSDMLATTISGNATRIPASGGAAKTARIDVQGADIVDAGMWNGRLYILDAPHNRITRHASDTEGYGAPQFYLKDATDVSRGVSMAIDGGVWILSADGGITHLMRGVKEAFAAGGTDPAMTSAKRIRTTADSPYLHVLDAGRIVRFDKKTGALVAQFEHADLSAATDFTVSDDSRIATVAAGDRVLRFSLPE